MKSDFEKALNTNGLKKRDYLKLIKSSDEDLEKEFFNQALEKVGTNLVLMNMKNNIEENDKDYEEKYIKTFEKHFPSEAQELSKFISYFLRIFEKLVKQKLLMKWTIIFQKILNNYLFYLKTRFLTWFFFFFKKKKKNTTIRWWYALLQLDSN
ncbi:hypothetical protein NWP96_05440 [Mycoplasmopsis cynos]|nr:hypothetical protein [Mycoplasmopsis cynos]